MGAAQNQGTSTQLQLHHRHLRNCRSLTRDTGTVLVATLPTQTPTVAKWKDQLSRLSEAQPDRTYLLLPLDHHFEEGGVCSSTGELRIEYDHYPQLLSTEIAVRKKEGRRFSESELWYLLLAIVQAKCELDDNSHNLGDLQPGNVFLNARQEVKVASLYSWPGQTTSYRRAILDEETAYLAPEDVERLKLGAMDNKGNSESEMFAIGMTLFSTSLLHLNQDLYHIREREFDVNLFQQRLAGFQQDTAYSQIYKAIVCNLLEIDPAKRLTLHDLRLLLIKHKEPIIARKPLLIDNVSKKLQQSINILVQILQPNQQHPPQPPLTQSQQIAPPPRSNSHPSHPQPQSQSQAQHQPQPQPQPQSQPPQPQPQSQPQTQAQLQSQPQSHPQSQSQPQALPQSQPQSQTQFQPVNQQLQGSRQQLIAQTNEPRNIRQSGVSGSKERIMSFINFEGSKQNVSQPNSVTTIPSNPNIHPPHNYPNIPRQQLPINNTGRQPLISAQPEQSRSNVPRGYSPQVPIEAPIKSQYIDNQPKFRPFEALSNQHEKQPPIPPQPHPQYQYPSQHQPRPLPQYQPQTQVQPQLQREPLFDSFARAQTNLNGKLIEESNVQEIIVEKPAEVWENDERSMVKQLNLLMQTKKEGFSLNEKALQRNGIQSPVQQCQSAYQSPEQIKRFDQSPIQPSSQHEISSKQLLSPEKSADLHYEADASSYAEQDVTPSSRLEVKPAYQHYLSHTISEPSYEQQSSAQYSNNYNNEESHSINPHYSIANPSGHFNEEHIEYAGQSSQPSQHSQAINNYHNEIQNLQHIQPSIQSHQDESQHSQYSKLKEEHISQQQLSYHDSNLPHIEASSSIPKLPLQSVTPNPPEAHSSSLISVNLQRNAKSSIAEPILIVQQSRHEAAIPTFPSPISEHVHQISQPVESIPETKQTSSFYESTPLHSLPNPTLTKPISKLSEPVSLPSHNLLNNLSTSQNPKPKQNIVKPVVPENSVPNLFANLLASVQRPASPPSSFAAAKLAAQIAPSTSEATKPEVKVIDGHDTSTKTTVEALKQQHHIQTIEFESIANYKQFASTKFSPMVKVWGVQKGELKVKDMGTIQQAYANTGTVINQLSSPDSNKESYPSSLATPKFPAASRASNIEDSPPKQNNFILIEETKLAAQIQKNLKQVLQSNEAFLRTNLIEKSREASSVPKLSSNDEQAIYQKKQVPQDQFEQNENENYHTYVDIATDGTFEQCWQELIKIIEKPQNYSSSINQQKVRVEKGNKWSVKIGPALMSIEANKEQGKILLSSKQGSKSQGQVLAGVFKDEDKRQRIWFNSALYHKSQPFPARNLFEEALNQAKVNLSRSNR